LELLMRRGLAADTSQPQQTSPATRTLAPGQRRWYLRRLLTARGNGLTFAALRIRESVDRFRHKKQVHRGTTICCAISRRIPALHIVFSGRITNAIDRQIDFDHAHREWVWNG